MKILLFLLAQRDAVSCGSDGVFRDSRWSRNETDANKRPITVVQQHPHSLPSLRTPQSVTRSLAILFEELLFKLASCYFVLVAGPPMSAFSSHEPFHQHHHHHQQHHQQRKWTRLFLSNYILLQRFCFDFSHSEYNFIARLILRI